MEHYGGLVHSVLLVLFLVLVLLILLMLDKESSSTSPFSVLFTSPSNWLYIPILDLPTLVLYSIFSVAKKKRNPRASSVEIIHLLFVHTAKPQPAFLI